VITPTPDAVTMLLVAVPMIILYEISMLLVRK
jgi:Sec-independent protein secretion pathway component TatC